MPEQTRVRLGNLLLGAVVGLLAGTVTQSVLFSERMARVETSVEWIRRAVERLESVKP